MKRVLSESMKTHAYLHSAGMRPSARFRKYACTLFNITFDCLHGFQKFLKIWKVEVMCFTRKKELRENEFGIVPPQKSCTFFDKTIKYANESRITLTPRGPEPLVGRHGVTAGPCMGVTDQSRSQGTQEGPRRFPVGIRSVTTTWSGGDPGRPGMVP